MLTNVYNAIHMIKKSVSPVEIERCFILAFKIKTYSEEATTNVSRLCVLPGALTQAIRNFAKSLESWLTNAMMNIPEEMVRIKVQSPLC